ncbi:MAG: polymer-forming cytoskeletal protein [Deltaproteobacteria bacterium]|nr:polymer-forming cytoskeletal protein [Deltaproteobacteria bacterium]
MQHTQEIDESQITTVIAEDLEIKGTVKFRSSLMIKGILEGEIFSEGLLIIGPTAKVTATITTRNLISHGEVTGNVTASEQVILKSTSVHQGDISTPNITIESGALFNGTCIMKREPKKELEQKVIEESLEDKSSEYEKREEHESDSQYS